MRKNAIRVMMGLFLAAVFGIAGCGGGVEVAPPATESTATSNITLKENVVVVDNTSVSKITSTNIDVNGTASISLSAGSDLGEKLVTNSVLSVLPGADNRFPFGLSAKVESISTNLDGTKQVILQPATLAEVASAANFSSEPIALNADNFVGVIAPSAVSAPLAAKITAKFLPSSVKTAINGGIRVSNGESALFKTTNSATASFKPGEVAINLKIELSKTGVKNSTMQPFGNSSEAVIEVTGSLKNLKLNLNNDFNYTDGLKSMDMRTTGDIQLESKLTGKGSATFGYDNQAWDEVASEQIKLLGIGGKLSGLSSKDKLGKYPVAGLVWTVAVPGVVTPFKNGVTQTPIRAAKAGGVILWVYTTLSGEISIEGSVGARVNPGHFELGVTKATDGSLEMIHTLAGTAAGHFIEAPFIDGKVTLAGKLGVALDLDFFLLGIRFANASLDVEGRLTESVSGNLTHFADNLAGPYDWEGNSCFSTKLGAGAIFGAGVNVGVEVKTGWGKVGGEFSYAGQWPSEDDMLKQGWSGIGNATWFTAAAGSSCFPKPVVNSLTIAEAPATKKLTVTAFGDNFPDDLKLAIYPDKSCTGQQTESLTTSKVVYTCTKVTSSALSFNLSSDKAQNLDKTAVSSVTYNSPTYDIIGTVTANGVALAGATVTLSNNNGSSNFITDSQGKYRFPNRGNDIYQVSVSMPGYYFNQSSQTITMLGADVNVASFVGIITCTSPQVLTNGVCVTPAPTGTTAAALSAQLSPYTFYDIYVDGSNLYALASQAKSNGVTYTDPDGVNFTPKDLYIIKIDQSGKVDSSIFDSGRAIGYDKNIGTIAVGTNNITAFISYKTQNSTYGMEGSTFVIDKVSMILGSSSQLFSGANWGWYPKMSVGGIEHFSFAGYYRYLNSTYIESVQPSVMASEYDNYRLSHSGNIIPASPVNSDAAVINNIISYLGLN